MTYICIQTLAPTTVTTVSMIFLPKKKMNFYAAYYDTFTYMYVCEA